MDFRTFSLKWKLESHQKGEESTSTTAKQVFCVFLLQPHKQWIIFLQICLMLEENLLHCPTKKGFSDSNVPVNCLPDFPKPLTGLFDLTAMSLPYPDLLKKVMRFTRTMLLLLIKQN